MYSELKEALGTLADGKHPVHGWRIRANHATLVDYVGITGRRGRVRNWVVHPPRIGDHIRWMHFKKKALDFAFSYYEVVNVLWDVRSNYNYMYLPGEEAEPYLTVFVRPVKNSPGQEQDRAEHREWRRREARRRARKRRSSGRASP
jgi:hypothetical protein